MKMCLPISKNEGLNSPVCEHFGSAPFFMVVDTDTLDHKAITNTNQHHAHGMCQPLKALGGREVDAVAVGGIGMGALMKLQAQGVRVFRVTEGTVGDNISFILKQKLPDFDARFTCGGHTGGGCAH